MKRQLEQNFFLFRRIRINTILAQKYIPNYVQRYLKWYERDGRLTYIDELKYKEFCCGRDAYFDKVKVVHFDIIYSSCNPNYKMEKNLVGHQTIKSDDFCNYTNDDKTLALSAALLCPQNDAFAENVLSLSHLSKEKIRKRRH